MALRSLFDENRRREIRRGIALGRFPARKPAPEPSPQAGNPHSELDQRTDGPAYIPLNRLDHQLLCSVYAEDAVSARDALAKGADPNVRDADSACATIISGTPHSRSWGDTALMIASKKGNLGLVKLLIQFKADVNLDFNYGSCPFPTALSYSQKHKHLHIEHELLAAGAVR